MYRTRSEPVSPHPDDASYFHPILPQQHDDMTDRDSLRDLLIERSVRLGDFTLASGAKADYYIDARRTTMSAEGQRLVGLVALETIEASGLDITHVGGLTMGADPVARVRALRAALDSAAASSPDDDFVAGPDGRVRPE